MVTGWDFSKYEHRRQALDIMRKDKPWLVVGSPPCTVFSMIQHLNMHIQNEDWREKFEIRKAQAIKHLRFCSVLYRLQSAEGRYFLHEHPHGASSWDLDIMKNLEKLLGAVKVRADQCEYGLTTSVKGEVRPAKKPTSFLTNSRFIGEELSRTCSGDNSHFSLMEGRAAKAAEYPPELCKSICRGIVRQKEFDMLCLLSSNSMTTEDLEQLIQKSGYPKHWVDRQHGDGTENEHLQRELNLLKVKDGVAWAFDDVSGAPLDPEKFKQARGLEMQYFREMVVYQKVDRKLAHGHKVVRTKWIDIRKGRLHQ